MITVKEIADFLRWNLMGGRDYVWKLVSLLALVEGEKKVIKALEILKEEKNNGKG